MIEKLFKVLMCLTILCIFIILIIAHCIESQKHSPSFETVGSVSEVTDQLAEDPPNQLSYIVTTRFRVTAYCPCEICCEKFADGITASGHKIKPGDKFVAADASMFGFNNILDIPGYGKVPVLDRGGKIKGWHLDVFFPTHQEAKNWGVQNLEVGIYQ